MLLPHGFEGQGPEHSSARLERFLQMSDDDPRYIPDEENRIQESNWQVCNISTPANYFHALRRQIHRQFRKPLIVMSPKSLLRHKECVSSFEDMGPESTFKRTISERQPDFLVPDDEVKRLILCSGKVYYELKSEREKLGRNDVALVTMEQISPFPFAQVLEDLRKYPNAEIMWCQEEPLNMGAWSYVEPRLNTAVRSMNDNRIPSYAGRLPSAAPGTGHMSQHVQEVENMLAEAFKQ
jgi:2-oxoglutarate dehydrogenase E1 component